MKVINPKKSTFSERVMEISLKVMIVAFCVFLALGAVSCALGAGIDIYEKVASV